MGGRLCVRLQACSLCTQLCIRVCVCMVLFAHEFVSLCECAPVVSFYYSGSTFSSFPCVRMYLCMCVCVRVGDLTLLVFNMYVHVPNQVFVLLEVCEYKRVYPRKCGRFSVRVPVRLYMR